MSRTDLLLFLGFFPLLGGVVWVVFGNPFALEGAKLQEFAGYIIGVLLSAVGLLVVANQAMLRTISSGPHVATHDLTEPTRKPARML